MTKMLSIHVFFTYLVNFHLLCIFFLFKAKFFANSFASTYHMLILITLNFVHKQFQECHQLRNAYNMCIKLSVKIEKYYLTL